MTRNAQIPPTDQIEPPFDEASAASALFIVAISKIQPYERNPRQGRNPEYDRIKDSIRSQGLDQPLVITQRPGTANYIVHAGGNTRLLVLKELVEETGEERFARIPCVFRPWQRESDVLLAHLRENELRGSLTFIDKARAIFDAKQLLGKELGLEKVSQRKLEVELKSMGFSISNSSICLMLYAVERLLNLVPRALEAGMGRRTVEHIRALERAAGVLWEHFCAGGESAFDEVFAALCRRYDKTDWDTDMLQGAIESEIAEEAEMSIHTIRVALDAEIKGRKVEIPEFVPIKEPPLVVKHESGGGDSVTSEELDGIKADETGSSRSLELPPNPAASNQPQDNLDEPSDEVTEPLIDTNPTRPTDLKSLRSRAWTLAARLAQRNGLGDLVEPVSGQGLGYILRDVPDPVLADQLDEEALAKICMLWWQLAACAEMTYAPLESIIPLLPADSVLRRALAEEDAELLFSSIWTLDPGHTGYRLWRLLPDRDWQDLLHLMDTYRRIRLLAAESAVSLWN